MSDTSHNMSPSTRPTELARLELSRLPCELSLDQALRSVCELCSDAVDVERVGIWLFIDNGEALRCAHLYERSKQSHSAGALLRVADFPNYFAALKIRRAIPAEIAASDPWTTELRVEYLAPLGITSMLDAGIFVDGELVGAVCHEHVGPPREWSLETRDFASSAADVVALRLQSAKVRELQQAFLTQKKRQASLAHSAAMEQLAAGIAHDFRNLLFVIQTFGRTVERSPNLSPEAQHAIAEIENAVQRGAQLARELTEFACPTPAPPTVLDLAATTRKLLPSLRAAGGPLQRIRLICGAELGAVLIEERQYTRLLMNLVMNACESMPEGGQISIRLNRVTRRNAEATPQVALVVSDNGPGMDPATQERLFEPYYTTKSKGTGLGMAIVKRIVDRVGGEIQVRSELGSGASLRILFPAIRAPKTADERTLVAHSR